MALMFLYPHTHYSAGLSSSTILCSSEVLLGTSVNKTHVQEHVVLNWGSTGPGVFIARVGWERVLRKKKVEKPCARRLGIFNAFVVFCLEHQFCSNKSRFQI